MTPEKPRQGVDAVEVVGTILQAMLRLPRPTRLKELETVTGIASAKLHRYLVSMIRCGLVSRQETGNRYDFGLLTYRMGQLAAHDQSALSLLEPMFEQFVKELGDSELGQAVGIGQWVGHGVAIVRWFESSSALSVRMKPGVSLSITSSATAKLLAAYMPRERTEPLVRRELLEKGSCTEREVRRVYAEYGEIRKIGIARSLESRRSGLNALSVPLFDQHGNVAAAITTLGMAPHFDADTNGVAAQMLRRLGQELSREIRRGGEVKREYDPTPAVLTACLQLLGVESDWWFVFSGCRHNRPLVTVRYDAAALLWVATAPCPHSRPQFSANQLAAGHPRCPHRQLRALAGDTQLQRRTVCRATPVIQNISAISPTCPAS